MGLGLEVSKPNSGITSCSQGLKITAKSQIKLGCDLVELGGLSQEIEINKRSKVKLFKNI